MNPNNSQKKVTDTPQNNAGQDNGVMASRHILKGCDMNTPIKAGRNLRYLPFPNVPKYGSMKEDHYNIKKDEAAKHAKKYINDRIHLFGGEYCSKKYEKEYTDIKKVVEEICASDIYKASFQYEAGEGTAGNETLEFLGKMLDEAETNQRSQFRKEAKERTEWVDENDDEIRQREADFARRSAEAYAKYDADPQAYAEEQARKAEREAEAQAKQRNSEWRKPEAEVPFMPQEMFGFMGEFCSNTGSPMAHVVADYLEGPMHFWMLILQKFAIMPTHLYPYIIEEIMRRYACLIRTQDVSLGAGYAAIFAVAFSLKTTFDNAARVNLRNHFDKCDLDFLRKEAARMSAEVKEGVDSETKEPVKWRPEAGEEKDTGTFGLLALFAKVDKILSNVGGKSLVADIIKALSIGALATTAMSSGKFSTFTMDGANALVNYLMRKYTSEDSMYAGLFRAATGVYSLIYNWFTCPSGGTFVEYITSMSKVDDMFSTLRELHTEVSVWDSLDARKKNDWSKRFVIIKDFSRIMLGSETGWKDAKRFFNPKQLDEFRQKFIIVEANNMTDIVCGLRRAPFAMLVSGGTALGKTGLTHDLQEFFLQLEGVPRELLERLCYVMQDNGSEFWDGYQFGTLGIVMDDMCSRLASLDESSGGDKMRKMLGELLNNQRMLANKAALAQKENTAVRPTFVIGNTNVPTLMNGEIFRHAGIADRRWNVKVHVEVKPEFATDGGTLCQAKAAADYAERLANGDDSPDDYWNYHVYEVKAYNATRDGVPENQLPEPVITTRLVRVAVFTSGPLFYDFLKEKYEQHHAYQYALLDKLNAPKVFGTKAGPMNKPPNYGEPEKRPQPTLKNLKWLDGVRDCPLKAGDVTTEGSGNEPDEVSPPASEVCWEDAQDIYIARKSNRRRVKYQAQEESDAYSQYSVYLPVAVAVATTTTFGLWKAFDYCRTQFRRIDKIMATIEGKTPQVENMLDQTQGLINMVGNHAPHVEDILNRTHNVSVYGQALASDFQAKYEATVSMLKNATTYLGTVAAFVGASLMVYKTVRYFTDEEIKVALQGNVFSAKPAGPVRPVKHVNDGAAHYEPPMSVGNASYLTQQSSAAQGPHLYNKALAANVEIKFQSVGLAEDGFPLKIWSHGFFVKGKWLVFNHHCLPKADDKRGIWDNYVLIIFHAGTEYRHIPMTKADVMANMQFYHDNRDMVALHVPKARDFPDISVYMPDIPGKIEDNPVPMGLKIFPVGMHTRIKDGKYYGPEPAGCEWGPSGYTSRAIQVVVDKDDKNTVAMARINVVTEVGDCGSLFLGLKSTEHRGEIPHLVYGMHMGTSVDNPIEKLIVPFRKQDFDGLTIPFQMYDEVPSKVYPDEEKYKLELAISSEKPPGDFDVAAVWNIIHKCPVMTPKHHFKDVTEKWLSGVVTPLNGTTFVPTGSAKFVGQRVRLTSARFKSKNRKTPLGEILATKDFTKTPFKKFGSGKVVMQLGPRDVAIGAAVALSKAYSQPKDRPWSQQLAADANAVVDAMITDVIVDMRERPETHVLKQLHQITKEEALNGMCEEEGEAKLKAGNAANKHTSAGYPWNEMGRGPTGGKGKLGYIIRVPGLPDQLHEDMEVALAALRVEMAKGPYKVLFKAIIKDEVMKPEKLAEGRIRFILVMPMEGTLLTREYLLTLCRVMALNPFFFGAMVGIDSSSIQWEQLYNYLTAKGAKLFDGDFKGYEYVLYREITSAIRRYYEKLCELSENYDEAAMVMVHNLLLNMVQCVVDFFGNVHQFDSVNSSGNPLTTQINCTGIAVLTGIALLNQMRDLMGEHFDMDLFVRARRMVLRLASYGDDLLASMLQSKKYPQIQLLNQIVMQKQLAKYEIVFTDAAKSPVLIEPFPKECTFLGRSFSTDHKGRMVAKLEAVRIMKPLEFYTEHAELSYAQLLVSTLRSVLQETYYYGRETFDDLRAILIPAVAEMFELSEADAVKDYFGQGEEWTYDFFEEWFTAKYPKGAIVDPRYEEVLNQNLQDVEDLYEEIAEAMRANGTLH